MKTRELIVELQKLDGDKEVSIITINGEKFDIDEITTNKDTKNNEIIIL